MISLSLCNARGGDCYVPALSCVGIPTEGSLLSRPHPAHVGSGVTSPNPWARSRATNEIAEWRLLEYAEVKTSTSVV